jgi:hypothetical protein
MPIDPAKDAPRADRRTSEPAAQRRKARTGQLPSSTPSGISTIPSGSKLRSANLERDELGRLLTESKSLECQRGPKASFNLAHIVVAKSGDVTAPVLVSFLEIMKGIATDPTLNCWIAVPRIIDPNDIRRDRLWTVRHVGGKHRVATGVAGNDHDHVTKDGLCKLIPIHIATSSTWL